MRKALLSKGFRAVSTHHEMFWLYVGDKKTSIKTRLSHGQKEYGDKLLAAMRKSLKLSRNDFDRFMDCPMSGQDYLNFLLAAAHVVLPTSSQAMDAPAIPTKSQTKDRKK